MDTVILEARPSSGYVFDNWSGSIDGIADASQRIVSFKMVDVRTITANFSQSDLCYIVTATCEPSGGGSVDFSKAQPPGGYLVNENVSVYAAAQTGYVFSQWAGGDLAGNENPRTVLVSKDMSITAIFNPTVTVYCSPTEGGSYVVEPESSSGGYTVGTEVTISVEAAKGYRFVSWEGDASGSVRSITVTVNEPKTMTARFTEQSSSPWWLWVIVGPAGLFGALILVRLVYARMKTGAPDEPEQLDE